MYWSASDAPRCLGNSVTRAGAGLSDLDRSIELSSAVLQRMPNDSEALKNRALARYFKKDLAAARSDFEVLLKDRSAVRRGYPVVRLSMALRQSRQGTSALLSAYPREQWPTDGPRPLLEMAVGDGSADAAIGAAKPTSDCWSPCAKPTSTSPSSTSPTAI